MDFIVNEENTKLMRSDQKRSRQNVNIDSFNLGVDQNFVYLDNITSEIVRRIVLANKCYFQVLSKSKAPKSLVYTLQVTATLERNHRLVNYLKLVTIEGNPKGLSQV